MIEVCRTIAMLEYEWFQENEYRIRCRQTVLLDQKKHVTEMRLQLYKKLHGNVCSFMHMCGTVIDQLQRGLSRSSQLMAHVTMKEV